MTTTYSLDWEVSHLKVTGGGHTSLIYPTYDLGNLGGDVGEIDWVVNGTYGYITLVCSDGNTRKFTPTTHYSGGSGYTSGDLDLNNDPATGMPLIYLADAGGYGYGFQHHYPLTGGPVFGNCVSFPPQCLYMGSNDRKFTTNMGVTGGYVLTDWMMSDVAIPNTPVPCLLHVSGGNRYSFNPSRGPISGAGTPGAFSVSVHTGYLQGYGNTYCIFDSDHPHS